MKKIWRLTIPAAIFALAAAGCAGPTRTEMDYGTSCKLAVANQTLHPEAARNESPVTGMDAPAASKVYEKYVKGFEKPAGSEQTYIIPVAAQGGTFGGTAP